MSINQDTLFKKTLILIILGILSLPTFGQVPDRVDEKELMYQEAFLSARLDEISGKYEKAIASIKDLYKEDRSRAIFSYELSRLYWKIGDEESAVSFGEKANSTEPTNEKYAVDLATKYEELGQHDLAAQKLETVLKNSSDKPLHYEKAAFNYLASGDPMKAISLLDELEGIVGVNEDLIRRKYDIYRTLKDHQAAEAELLKLKNKYPKDTRILNNIANFYKQTGQEEKSNKLYQEIVAINPNDTQASLALAKTATVKNDDVIYLRSLNHLFTKSDIALDTKVKELIFFVEDLNPQSDSTLIHVLKDITDNLRLLHSEEAKSHAISGDIAFKIEDDKQAIIHYKKTLELDSRNYMVWTQLMYALLKQKEVDELRKYSEEAIDLFPNQWFGYVMNGRANMAKNDFDLAQEILEEAQLVAGKNKSAKLEIVLAKAELDLVRNTPSSEVSNLFSKIDYGPLEAERVGDLFAKYNAFEEAITYWKIAKKKGNDSDVLNQKIKLKGA